METNLGSFKLLAFCVLLTLPGSASSQATWTTYGDGNSIGIEVLKPDFERDERLHFPTGVAFLSARFAVRENVTFVGGLPFAFADFDQSVFVQNQVQRVTTATETAIGNPYLGLEIKHPHSKSFSEIGIRLPLAPDREFTARQVGLVSDQNRWEAFINDMIPVMVRINLKDSIAAKTFWRVRFGPTLWIFTQDNIGDDAELFVDYAGVFGYNNEGITIQGGIAGKALVTAEDANLAERSLHYFFVHSNLHFDRLHPGLSLQVPLDEDAGNNLFNFVVGINLGFDIR